jgi:cysteine desulfurase
MHASPKKPLIYMDHNATTPVRPEVLEALLPWYRENFGNPSSIHWAGRQVKGALEEAREKVAALAGCSASEVVFTSCGTEANNMAIKGVAAALRSRGNHIITTRVEHPAVINPCQFLEYDGFEVTWLDADADGSLDLDRLQRAIRPETILISVMFANNETGVISPVAEIAELAARHKVYFHCDAVQAAGKVPIVHKTPGPHLLSLSGHKLYAPKGVGALVVGRGVKLHPLLHGGSQERNRRAGTENVAGIVAFGRACELAQAGLATEAERLLRLRTRLEEGIAAALPFATIIGHKNDRLPNTSCIAFPGVPLDSLLMSLDLEGLAVSSGSACSSGTMKNSHVLSAMGLDASLATSAVRFSLGRDNTDRDVDRVLELLPAVVSRITTNV